MHQRYIHNLLISAVLLSACSLQAYRAGNPDLAGTSGNARAQQCLSLYANMDTYLYNHGIADVQEYRVPGYPFLRVNRFLSSFRNELSDMRQSVFWLQQLSQLDRESRLIEIRKIPDVDIQQLSQQANNRAGLVEQVKSCSGLLTTMAGNNAAEVADISSRAVVPDNYNTIMRVFGLYPLSSFFVMYGINHWHATTMASFGKPGRDDGNTENFLLYRPDTDAVTSGMDVAGAFKIARNNNPLSIPLLDDKTLPALFERYAPVWEIETLQEADHFGVPVWTEGGSIMIDISRPTVFDYVSYTRIHNQVLLQLNYTIWFPSRPVTGWLDILGGKLDGITWRVTLDNKGVPVFYDTMHNCGCYHMVFPDARYQLKDIQQVYEEPLLVPATAPVLHAGEHMVVTVESGTHYIRSIHNGSLDTSSSMYAFADYDGLRELPAGTNGYRSMFDERGLVAGTERKERWILWPMGIIEPGAMRQRGQHATAFIGRRHFDDPYLFQDHFSGPMAN